MTTRSRWRRRPSQPATSWRRPSTASRLRRSPRRHRLLRSPCRCRRPRRSVSRRTIHRRRPATPPRNRSYPRHGRPRPSQPTICGPPTGPRSRCSSRLPPPTTEYHRPVPERPSTDRSRTPPFVPRTLQAWETRRRPPAGRREHRPRRAHDHDGRARCGAPESPDSRCRRPPEPRGSWRCAAPRATSTPRTPTRAAQAAPRSSPSRRCGSSGLISVCSSSRMVPSCNSSAAPSAGRQAVGKPQR